jgi:hypothetical protein
MEGLFSSQAGLNHSGRFSDSRIILLAVPSHPARNEKVAATVFVPDYSGGPVPDFNGVPYYAS